MLFSVRRQDELERLLSYAVRDPWAFVTVRDTIVRERSRFFPELLDLSEEDGWKAYSESFERLPKQLQRMLPVPDWQRNNIGGMCVKPVVDALLAETNSAVLGSGLAAKDFSVRLYVLRVMRSQPRIVSDLQEHVVWPLRARQNTVRATVLSLNPPTDAQKC